MHKNVISCELTVNDMCLSLWSPHPWLVCTEAMDPRAALALCPLPELHTPHKGPGVGRGPAVEQDSPRAVTTGQRPCPLLSAPGTPQATLGRVALGQ